MRSYLHFAEPEALTGMVNISGASGAEPDTYVTFDMGNQTFAVDVQYVREIMDTQSISPLPNAPRDVLGLIDIRGESVAVVDLAGRLGMQLHSQAGEGRIIVFELKAGKSGATTPVGVLADHVRRVVAIAKDEIEAAPETLISQNSSALAGVARHDDTLVMLLDLHAAFELASDLVDPFSFT